MKPMIEDVVAVLETERVGKAVAGRKIKMVGVLKEMNRGLPTADKRAKGEEGECPLEMTVDAEGWCIVESDLGVRHSVPYRNVRIHSKKYEQEHRETSEIAMMFHAHLQDVEGKFPEAGKFCADLGLDMTGLSMENAVKIHEILTAVNTPKE